MDVLQRTLRDVFYVLAKKLRLKLTPVKRSGVPRSREQGRTSARTLFVDWTSLVSMVLTLASDGLSVRIPNYPVCARSGTHVSPSIQQVTGALDRESPESDTSRTVGNPGRAETIGASMTQLPCRHGPI